MKMEMDSEIVSFQREFNLGTCKVWHDKAALTAEPEDPGLAWQP